MVVKAAIGFLTTHGDDQLVGDGQAVINGLTNNPNFATPVPALATVSAALAAFTTAVAEAVNGGKEQTVAKKARRAELAALMRQLASYVTVTSNGDMEKLLSSGFPYQKPVRTPVGILPAPAAPSLKFGGRSGQLDASVSPMYGAGSYNWRVALASAPGTFVQTTQTIAGRCTFNGLTPGQIYSVQANAVGSAGPSDWSDVSDLMVV
jgi:hypothetical protein